MNVRLLNFVILTVAENDNNRHRSAFLAMIKLLSKRKVRVLNHK